MAHLEAEWDVHAIIVIQVGADVAITFGGDVLSIENFLLADFDVSDVLL